MICQESRRIAGQTRHLQASSPVSVIETPRTKGDNMRRAGRQEELQQATTRLTTSVVLVKSSSHPCFLPTALRKERVTASCGRERPDRLAHTKKGSGIVNLRHERHRLAGIGVTSAMLFPPSGQLGRANSLFHSHLGLVTQKLWVDLLAPGDETPLPVLSKIVGSARGAEC